MTDKTTLKIEVDSSAVRQATDDLRDMAAAAQDCESSVEGLIRIAARHGFTPTALEATQVVGEMAVVHRVEL